MRGSLFGIVIVLGCHHLTGSAIADDRISFYRMLLSVEQSALEAIRKNSVTELLTIHNDAMGFVVGEERRRWKPEPICEKAYIQLSVAALFYASAIEPSRSEPLRSASENAALGDKFWADYLDVAADCEAAIGITKPAMRVPRPSELLRRFLPRLPGSKSSN